MSQVIERAIRVRELGYGQRKLLGAEGLTPDPQGVTFVETVPSDTAIVGHRHQASRPAQERPSPCS